MLDELLILELHEGVRGRDYKFVDRLLEQNLADLLNVDMFNDQTTYVVDIVNAPDSEGKTALYNAAVEGDYEMVELLMENGADLFLSDSQREKTPDVIFAKIRETYKKAQELRKPLGKDGTAITLCGY